MKIEVVEIDSKIYVEMVVPHIRGTRKGKREYTTSDVLKSLVSMGYNTKSLKTLTECRVFNYQTEKRCHGSWVFLDTEKEEARKKFLKTLEEKPEPKKKTTRRKRKKKDE